MSNIKYQIIVHHLTSGITYRSVIIESSPLDMEITKDRLDKAAASQLTFLEFDGDVDGNTHIIPDTVLQQSVITLKIIKE